MNRLLQVLISLVLVANIALAQGSIEAKTTDGRIVVLKPDGTWEYKKVTPQSGSSTASNPKQNPGTNSVPPNFTGHDVGALFVQLRDLKKRLAKNEFETTVEYQQRLAQENQKPILENLTIRDTFSLLVANLQASYDADSQKMQFFLPVKKNRLAEIYRSLGRDKISAYDLDRTNLYSIELDDRLAYDGHLIFFDELNDLPLTEVNYRQGFSAEISLTVEEARRVKNTGKAVVLVQFEEPYVASLVNRQLRVRLIDAYFFDSQTGRILAKVSQSGR